MERRRSDFSTTRRKDSTIRRFSDSSLNRKVDLLTSPTESYNKMSFSSTTIFSLPPEILLHIFEFLNLKDLLNISSTHPFFKELVDCHQSVWKTVSFTNLWPSSLNIRQFNKAADLGNMEALIKLGVVYLYNEGFAVQSLIDSRKIISNGKLAADAFCRAEISNPKRTPFTWMFIRPPWAANGACCKECVFRNLKDFAKENKAPNINICIAKTLELLDADSHRQEVLNQLSIASDTFSPLARYMLWEYNYKNSLLTQEKSTELRCLRELREICNTGEPAARYTLCRLYLMGIYGGYTGEQAITFVREYIQSSSLMDVRNIFVGSELTPSMRHILIDWLVEVVYLRRYDSQILHLAVSIVDRFLRARSVTRAKLQLLGIATIVLCSRCMGQDIMTVREGAYLTDHTYSYEDVVRMMGEITACLKGRIRVMTCFDYVRLIGLAASNDVRTQMLSEFFCETALQYSDLSAYSHGRLASACIVLARLTLGIGGGWNDNLRDVTGFSMKELAFCVLHLHKRCIFDMATFDLSSSENSLQAIKLRYSDAAFLKVALTPMLTSRKLNGFVGVELATRTPVKRRCYAFEQDRDLIASPSRKSSRASLDRSFGELDCRREKAATPTLEMNEVFSNSMASTAGLDESGYDADEEDRDVSFVETSDDVAVGPRATTSESNLVESRSRDAAEKRNVADQKTTTVARRVSLSDLILPDNRPSDTFKMKPQKESFQTGKRDYASTSHAGTPSETELSSLQNKRTIAGSCSSPRCISAENDAANLSRNKRKGAVLTGNENKKSSARPTSSDLL